MKKIIAILLIAIMTISFVACDSGDTKSDDKGKPSQTQGDDNNDSKDNKNNDKKDDNKINDNGDNDDDDDNDNNTQQGSIAYNPPDFGEFNLENYNEVMKTYFGLDISTFDKWEVRYALTDTERIGNDLNAKRISLQGRYEEVAAYNELKTLFEKTGNVSNGTVWARGVQFGKGITWRKGEAFTTFEDYAMYYDETLLPTREAVSLLWLYDYNGHTIVINLDMGSGSFRLLAYFLS